MPLAKLARGHARLRPAEGRARQGPDHRRAGAAHRRDADRRLHEADRPGGDLGEHQEGQRDPARLGLVPGRAGRADRLRAGRFPALVLVDAQVAQARATSSSCRGAFAEGRQGVRRLRRPVHQLGRRQRSGTCSRSSSRSSAPARCGYIKKTGAALKSILKNPLPFVGNLVKAAQGRLHAVRRQLPHAPARPV